MSAGRETGVRPGRPWLGRAQAQGIVAAAAGIAVVTMASRIVGFGRTVVFARTVGATCLGDTYVTANTVPNIVFEVVAGGALASLVVPVLAGAAARGDKAEAGRIASALLGWTFLVLVPLMLVGLAVARPVMGLLIGSARDGCSRADELAVGTRMLVVFLPQVVLYGLAVVLIGILQAHRRFLGPALAPLLSSVAVIGCYLVYAARSASPGSLAQLTTAGELTLSIGTTVGVAVLAFSLVPPLRRLRLGLRPTLTFPPGVGSRVARLAVAGLTALAAQQLSVAVVLRLAHTGDGGTLVLYSLAWAVFLVPWAVLAVPLATSAFPALSAMAEAGDEPGYSRTMAGTTRAVLLVTTAAAAVVVASAVPVARLLVLHVPGNGDTVALAWTLVAFAPGLVGYGLVAHLTRALYARGTGRFAATATVIGWVVVIGVDLALVPAVDVRWRVVALGAGNTIGMSVAGVLLLVGAARATRHHPMRGIATTALTTVAAASVAAAAGWFAARMFGHPGVLASLGTSLVSAAVTLVAFVAVLAVVAPGVVRADLRALMTRRLPEGRP